MDQDQTQIDAAPLRPRPRLPVSESITSSLWGHILQRPTSPSLSRQALPNGISQSHSRVPLAPTDKTGTTMRILLHDTQAGFERFSSRVDVLIRDVEGAKIEISNVKKMFETERAGLLDDTRTIVNRCQLEMQKSVGQPVQAEAFGELRKQVADMDARIQGLDKRFDVLHLLNQTQSRTLQAIQEQQAQILVAVSSMAPALQAVPTRIDAAKLELKDCVRDMQDVCLQARLRLGPTSLGALSPSTAPPPHVLHSPESSPRPRKRRRLNEEDKDEAGTAVSQSTNNGSENPLRRRSCDSSQPSQAVPLPQDINGRPISGGTFSSPPPTLARILDSSNSNDVLPPASQQPTHRSSDHDLLSGGYLQLGSLPRIAGGGAHDDTHGPRTRAASSVARSFSVSPGSSSIPTLHDHDDPLQALPKAVSSESAPESTDNTRALAPIGTGGTQDPASVCMMKDESSLSGRHANLTSTLNENQGAGAGASLTSRSVLAAAPALDIQVRSDSSPPEVSVLEQIASLPKLDSNSDSDFNPGPELTNTNTDTSSKNDANTSRPIQRPMSLKDRKALGLLAHWDVVAKQKEGKRFILLDDEEEEDDDELSEW